MGKQIRMENYNYVIACLFVVIHAFSLSGCSESEDNIDVHKKEQMALMLVVSGDELTVKLPLFGTVNCWIDWDDGSTQRVSKSFPTHTYSNEGAYIVYISGTVTALNAVDLNEFERSSILGVLQWGKTGLTNMGNAFQGCTNLKYLFEDDLGSFSDVTNFGSAFSGCTGLREIPEGLFLHSNQIYNFSSTFQNCESLTEIPDGLFDNATATRYFDQTFQNCKSLTDIPFGLFDNCNLAISFDHTFRECESLTEIPIDLFFQCAQVVTFAYTFQDCVNLTRIPAGLFDNCSAANSFGSAFQNCKSLMEIPTGLFDKCKDIEGLFLTFANCDNLTGESPYTVINGTKVHLYERGDGNEYLKPTTPNHAFLGCTGLSDYADMPSDWK